MTERRRFMATAGGTMAAVTPAATVDAPYVIAQPKFQWRLSTAYPPALDVVNGAAHTTGEDRGGDERWAVPDRGLSGWPDHATVRLF